MLAPLRPQDEEGTNDERQGYRQGLEQMRFNRFFEKQAKHRQDHA